MLTLDQIENKVFNIELKGYCPTEVDGFLDEVMEDIESYMNQIQNLKNEVANYQRIINELMASNQSLKGKVVSLEQNANNSNSNVDLIKRVARLEEAVFNQNNNY